VDACVRPIACYSRRREKASDLNPIVSPQRLSTPAPAAVWRRVDHYPTRQQLGNRRREAGRNDSADASEGQTREAVRNSGVAIDLTGTATIPDQLNGGAGRQG
jgi:hypothetical protein